MRRICPRCRRSYPTHAGVCASDGAALLVVDPTGCPRAGTQLDDNLTILSLLGAGAMGTVYRGLQHSMGREVAVKVARPEYAESEDAVRRFLQEAGLASRLNHPNIITLFDFGRTKQGELFIMMELLEGRPLSHLIAAEGRVAPTRTVALMNQVCDAVHHAHEMDLVHRDLKPDNIFVIDGAGHLGDFVKVLDFGIAKVPVTQGGTPLTRTGAVCGTPAYMSPEQAGSKAVDRRSDVYALGVIAYELLCGARPFSGESTMEVLLAHLFTEPPTFATFAPDLEFPPALEEGVRSALSKQPARRPATAADFKERLRAAVYPAESGSRRTTPRPVAASGNHLDSTTLFGETPEPIPTATAPADEDPTSRSGMIALVALAASIMLIGAISAAIWVRTTLQEDVTLELQSPASLATVTPTATPAAEPPRMPAVQLEQGIATGWERVRGASRAPVEGARRARRGADSAPPQGVRRPAERQATRATRAALVLHATAPPSLEVSLVAVPSTAMWTLGGKSLGRGRATVPRPAPNEPIVLIARVGGRSRRVTVTSTSPEALSITLPKAHTPRIWGAPGGKHRPKVWE